MSNDARATKISEQIWDSHRSTLERLYVQEGKELQYVIDFMQNQERFLASKSQYEYQFRKWKFRKNLKRKDWPVVIGIVEKRRRLGKDSEILFNGIVLSDERIERETARYGSALKTSNQLPEGQQHDLPDDIVISTPPATCNSLVQSPRLPSTDINSSLIHTPPRFEHSWRIPRAGIRTLPMEYEPFAWVKTLDFTRLPQLTSATSNQLINQSKAGLARLNAMFYPTQNAVTNTVSSKFVILQYLISALLNNTELTGRTSLENIHSWLRSIPQPVLLEFFAALPKPVMPVLRERIFAAALEDDDGVTVQSMLTLGVDPFEMIPTAYEGPVQPLERALGRGQVEVAKTIISHICQLGMISSPDSALKLLLESAERIRRMLFDRITNTEWVELLIIPLLAGAKPIVACFRRCLDDPSLTRLILENGQGGIQGWLQAGLLTQCFDWYKIFSKEKEKEAYVPLLSNILTYCLLEKGHLLPKNDPEIERELSHAFLATLRLGLTWASQLVFETCSSSSISLTVPGYDHAVSQLILEGCSKGDWASAEKSADKEPQKRFVPQKDRRVKPRAIDIKGLQKAVSEDNLAYVEKQLKCGEDLQRFSLESWRPILDQAARFGHDMIALAIMQAPLHVSWEYDGIPTLLQHCRTLAMSTLLESDLRWNKALQAARIQGNYIMLDDLLFRMQILDPDPIFPGKFYVNSTESIQMALRALSYHAIQTNDTNLLKWLVDTGLHMDEIWYRRCGDGFGTFLKFSPCVGVSFGEGGGFIFDKTTDYGKLPSLLYLAAKQNKTSIIRFLLAEGAENRDSITLMHAVKDRLDIATINMLLEWSEIRSYRRTGSYGSAALRCAIRQQNYILLQLLADKVDVEKMEYLYPDPGENEEVCISPLGEAIQENDLEAIEIILSKGVSPNALVAHDGIQFEYGAWDADRTVLKRLTPLLAAIDMRDMRDMRDMQDILDMREVQNMQDMQDMQDMSIVETLIKSGAEIDYPPKQGLLRTPLQRAAEIGSFEIVGYLLKCGAPVDSIPFYSGGTPLQLAAMGGYVGIATLLLERGANVNFPPAKGAGRTAFEAASEWGRVDMLCLLVKWGVDLDLVVGEETTVTDHNDLMSDNSILQDPGRDTQYLRALHFAEKQGQMASKRFVEHLYHHTHTAAGQGARNSQPGSVSGQNDWNMDEFLENWDNWDPNLPVG
ncbi:ankyrin [Dothidotthia symphoricarpi CBS 119687]|uniref:Ankyrin n=1 Tax=Dothidotthia symphoricarpi CBS 119687 TaxID=1392245 RepID=A0A6A6AQB8_9PLEO|nr:ankyrin [Dothidotthia symphoricarpi CBS 119687]KAF2134192.1 ankyrin [Dothidotthia symphoricarpi CBS 119687]